MKESPERRTNPLLSDEENHKVDFWKDPKSLENAKEMYIDKKITSYDQESGFHVVKDICVDEGLSHEEKTEIKKANHHELSCNPIIINGDKHDNIIKDDLDNTNLLFSVTKEKLNGHKNLEYNHDDPDEENLDTQFLKHENTNSDSSFGTKGEKDTALLIPEATKDHLQMDKRIESEIDYQNPSERRDSKEDSFIPNELENESKDANGPSNLMQTDEQNLDSNSDSLNDSSVEQLVSMNQDQLPNDVDQRHLESSVVVSEAEQVTDDPELIATDPHEMGESNRLQHGGGESSFSVVGPVSGLITYSGPIAASGSMSLRSDGSNTSVRSFAFPILQTEWNSSPVRMVKVDQRHSRKHRSWKQALICCKF